MHQNFQDPKLWTICETIAAIGLHFGIMHLKSKKINDALDYLFMAQQHLEPLPESDWINMIAW